ncbi:ABC transporter substrate-binding protein [Marinivivus vitaminiproducens]|uniref:ABC transporter substrate-binding protein n=1 Tax=Marinivivus vitaminiproducens TaxID=3035935 RepID=UPI0027A59A3E|nr:ABC transporter substrate-binding protein [Geminicoccaceae bacterium SCSIO 64248]
MSAIRSVTRPSRRECLQGAVALAAAALASRTGVRAQAVGMVRARDVAGRTVSLPAPARRIVLSSPMNLDLLTFVHPDPIGLLAGWPGLNASSNADQLEAMRRHYPGIDDVPVIGRVNLDSAAAEQLIGMAPDLVVLNLWDIAGRAADPDGHPLVRTLNEGGIPVVIVDTFQDPLAHTAPSLRALGRLLGTDDRVERFLAFYRDRLDRVAARIAQAGDALHRPSVFLHAHAAGPVCCFTPGTGAFDAFIRLAGGWNIAAEVLSTPTGQLSIEQVIARRPEVYVATAGYTRDAGTGYSLGRDVTADTAEPGFAALLARPELAVLDAVASGNAHGLWHDFTHSPLHLVAIEVMARWFHPERFADIDPAETLAEINRTFLTVPVEGTFWLDQQRS